MWFSIYTQITFKTIISLQRRVRGQNGGTVSMFALKGYDANHCSQGNCHSITREPPLKNRLSFKILKRTPMKASEMFRKLTYKEEERRNMGTKISGNKSNKIIQYQTEIPTQH